MIMRRIALLIALVAVIGVGAYFAVSRFTVSTTSSASMKEALDQALQKLPPDWKVTYKSVDYTPVMNQAALKGVEIHSTGAVKLDATVDEVDLNGLALDLGPGWSQAAANPAGLAPDKALPVADSIAIKGLALHLDNQDVKLASAQITKLRLYPGALLHTGVPSYADMMKFVQHPPSDPKPEDILPVLRWASSIVLGVGYDSYTAEDLSGTAKLTDPGAPAPEVTFAAKKFAVTNVDRGKLEAATESGITVKAGPGFDATVDHVNIAGLDFRDAMSQLLSGAPLDPSMLNGIALKKLEYGGITVKTPSGAPVTFGEASVSNVAFAHSLLVSGDFSVTGVKLTKAQLADEQEMLDAFNKMGLETMTISYGAGYRWDVDKKTASLKGANVKIDELGELTLAIDLAGIEKPEDFETNATLNHAVLRYSDASFVGRALKMGAEESGADPAAYKQMITGMVQVQASSIGKSAGIAAAAKSIGAFLNDPHNLTVELTPPTPLLLATIDSDKDLPPDQIFNKLGVKVTANQ
jgi:hypothetical protein